VSPSLASGVDLDDLPPGTVLLGGKLMLEGTLERGPATTDYSAWQADGTRVAFKLLASRYTSDVHMQLRFQNEAKILASLSDLPFIVKARGLYRVPELGGRWGLVQDLVVGSTLADHLMSGLLPIRSACGVLCDVADALAFLHERGVIHRDIKPSNIMITGDGDTERTMLLGFGDACSSSLGRAAALLGLTQGSQRPGTKEYMAPEQALAMAPTPLCDVYALAVTLFEALIGDIPYAGRKPDDIVTRKCDPRFPSFSIADEFIDFPEALVGLVDAGLQREPERRPSAATFRDRLEDILADLDDPSSEDLSIDPDAPLEPHLRGKTQPTPSPERAHRAIAGTIEDPPAILQRVHHVRTAKLQRQSPNREESPDSPAILQRVHHARTAKLQRKSPNREGPPEPAILQRVHHARTAKLQRKSPNREGPPPPPAPPSNRAPYIEPPQPVDIAHPDPTRRRVEEEQDILEEAALARRRTVRTSVSEVMPTRPPFEFDAPPSPKRTTLPPRPRRLRKRWIGAVAALACVGWVIVSRCSPHPTASARDAAPILGARK